MKTKVITASLIVGLCLLFSPPVQSQNKETVKACGVPCVVGIIVIGAGVVIGFLLAKYCKKHLPPPMPPPPPDEPPPVNNCTNAVPGHPDWPKTNCPPVKKMAAFVALLDDSAIDVVDISTNGWSDAAGNPYLVSFSTVLQSSTNVSEWRDRYAVTGYVSFGAVSLEPSNTVTVVYDMAGAPLYTNFSSGVHTVYGLAQTNEQRQEFFRLRLP